jgi:hypothetical protein
MQHCRCGNRPAAAVARAMPASGWLFAAGMFVLQAGTAAGQGTGPVSIELNRLEPVDGSCQAYLVVGNRTASSFDSRALDLVMFDAEGIVSRRMAVDLAPLPAGKTSVRVFSLDGNDCETVGRVLLNSVLSCRDASGEQPDCLGLIETLSRTATPFIE